MEEAILFSSVGHPYAFTELRLKSADDELLMQRELKGEKVLARVSISANGWKWEKHSVLQPCQLHLHVQAFRVSFSI